MAARSRPYEKMLGTNWAFPKRTTPDSQMKTPNRLLVIRVSRVPHIGKVSVTQMSDQVDLEVSEVVTSGCSRVQRLDYLLQVVLCF